ncbi:MAG: L,D-transpeptidase family protein [Streptosporangiales bacterium]|nr:L,D-transpeptidase family protein [Streptosporangiales bacterium]
MHPSVAPSRRSRLWWIAVAGLMGVVLLVVAGCQGDALPGRADEPPKPQAKIAIGPQDGTKKARPDRPITVGVQNGKITKVTVESKSGKRKVTGELSDDRTSWTSEWTLYPDTSYIVNATAVDEDGRTTSTTSRFTTLEPDRTVRTGAAPLDGEKVGVGMPIIVYFTKPVDNRKNVERALEVKMSEPVEGAWHWVSDEEVQFRPREYWPEGEKVKLVAHMAGVRAGDGLYGDKNQVVDFEVGDRHVSVVDANRYRMVVRDGDEVVRKIPVSMGKPSFETRSGVHIAQEKAGTVVMDSATIGRPGEYRLTTNWNVRISYSGEFVHSAPWSVGSQGSSNVSHGCVNASPSNAEWFFNFTNRGDIIKVKGTSKQLEFGNGPTPWVLSWKEWVDGSALGSSINGK